jgi:hypothetical protein
MQYVSAVVTWLGAISITVAVLAFWFAGAWIRVRGEVDDARQIRLVVTNRGRADGEATWLGVGTPSRRWPRRGLVGFHPVEPEIVVSGFEPTVVPAGAMRVWTATWPPEDVYAKRLVARGVIEDVEVRRGSRLVRVGALANGKWRMGRLRHVPGTFVQPAPTAPTHPGSEPS